MKKAQSSTALNRIHTLFEQAEIRPKFAKRYVTLARKLSSRFKVRIPTKWRRRFCKNCNAFLTPGKNCTVRKRKNLIVIRCIECESIRRIKVKR